MDVETLSQSQREAVSQLQALMNGADADVAVDVLESVDWDVQVCWQLFMCAYCIEYYSRIFSELVCSPGFTDCTLRAWRLAVRGAYLPCFGQHVFVYM